MAQQNLRDLYLRPGFLLRRAQQISSALFMEETAALGVTTTQYGVLRVLSVHEPVDQISIAKLLKLDRSTTGLVVKNLEGRNLVERVVDPEDRRRRVLRMTKQGRELLEQLAEPTMAAHDRALSVFTPDEARMFVQLLSRFVEGHDRSNDHTKA